MTENELLNILNGKRRDKDGILNLARTLENHPHLIGTILVAVAEQDKSRETFNACWAFDHLMRKKPVYLLPFMDEFITLLPTLTWETNMRPLARVLEGINEAFFKFKDPAFIKIVTEEHQNIMLDVCFDWLIGQHKVATKVFAMTSLFYLGEKFDWVRPELKSVVEQQIATGSAGFKSRGGKILFELKKLGY